VSSILVNGKVYLIHTTWVSRVYLTMKAFQEIQINKFSGNMLSYYICRGRSNQHMITDATAS
jgi:hypothetical protein